MNCWPKYAEDTLQESNKQEIAKITDNMFVDLIEVGPTNRDS
jgi:hypothetical protein